MGDRELEGQTMRRPPAGHGLATRSFAYETPSKEQTIDIQDAIKEGSSKEGTHPLKQGSTSEHCSQYKSGYQTQCKLDISLKNNRNLRQ